MELPGKLIECMILTFNSESCDLKLFFGNVVYMPFVKICLEKKEINIFIDDSILLPLSLS